MTGRGRPSTGVKVQVRIPADVLAVIDSAADRHEMSRAECVRIALSEWLAWVPIMGGTTGRGSDSGPKAG
jgi:hypothetical protein